MAEPYDADAALEEALEREDERRAEQYDAHDAYVAWMGDRAERALTMLTDDELTQIKASRASKGTRPNGHAKARDEKAEARAEKRYTLTGEMDAVDLMRLELPDVLMVVEGLIAEGTTVLASLPKLGKSWACVQLAVECALGGEFLGRRVVQGDVLYLPLEDGRRRTQSRFAKVLAGREIPRGRLTVRWDAPPLGEGMEAMIEEWLDSHPAAVLVIVDTLGRVRTPGDGRRNAYQVDVQDVGRIQSLLRDRAVALVLVHHTKKGKEDDFVSQVSGTLGIAGSADTILIVNRKRLDRLATIEVTSRELPEDSIGVRFDDGLWSVAPEALAGASVQRMAVYDAISLHGPLWPVAIARLLRSERTAVQHLASSLMEDGLVVRTPAGYVTAEAAGLGQTEGESEDNSHSIH